MDSVTLCDGAATRAGLMATLRGSVGRDLPFTSRTEPD